MGSKKREIESLNDTLYTDLSIEELENRLAMEDLPERLQLWACGCDTRACDKCDQTFGW